jgi:hypothetical protein
LYFLLKKFIHISLRAIFLKNKKAAVSAAFLRLVRLARFELASFRRRILSPLCMPFHHSRIP